MANQKWAEEQSYEYEIWTDDARTLTDYFSANYAPASRWGYGPKRVTMLLDANGALLVQYTQNVQAGTHPQDVLEDCDIIFGRGW